MSNTNPPQPTPPQPDPSTSPQPDPSTSIFSPRSGKQFSIFVAGAAFFGFSAFITRRALTRRYKASIPRFYQPSNQPSTRVNGAMEAFEALNIATINVASVAIMMTGGLLWAYDISTLEELRRKLRGGMGWDVSAKDAEEEFEEWLATTLARKEEKQRRKGEEGEWRDTNERGRPR